MSKRLGGKAHLIVRFLWIPGVVCMGIADLLCIIVILNHCYILYPESTFSVPNYLYSVPFILIAAIALILWASSSWRYVLLVCGAFIANTLLCFSVGELVGFWSNPWLVVSGWLWALAAIGCFLVKLGRWFFLCLRRKANIDNGK